ncbi:glycosyltransferase [Candidatus Woesearchaeota archaeon]|nr:glycosyltransferase [Candidatus Woesearchaeota archaeon]HIH38154.1 glycosyltransferase [Candidatus Woesearchaeota archaeon]HIH49405.1 glycosyltransferase [Candidatus Woesearchaeota archaeon]HIJ03662.1 glycosyltransferase [Candidatus Woesearchaeota archaeon]
MRIGIVYDAVYPYSIGGVEKRIYELAMRLCSHEVHLFGMKYWPGSPQRTKGHITYHGVSPAVPMYKKKRRYPGQVIRFTLGLNKYLNNHMGRTKLDVLDVQNFPYLPAFVCKEYCRKRKIPFMITWHEFLGSQWEEFGLVGGIGRIIEKKVLGLTKNVVAGSPLVQRCLVSRGIYPISLITNGINLARIRQAKPMREHFDLIYAGRLVREKHVDLLIRAAAKLKKSVCIIGTGPELSSLQKLAQAKGTKASFLGSIPEEELYQRIKSSSLFVLPSTREGYGLIVQEALACGTPVITTNHQKNGARLLVGREFLFRASVQGIIDKIHDVEKHPHIPSNILSKDNPPRPFLDWDEIADQYESLLRKIVIHPSVAHPPI